MTLWMPKKRPLYAPMLATFGGGSVRGFQGAGGAGGFAPNSLMFHVDAGDPSSYTSGSSTWNDISGNGFSVTLTNVGHNTSSGGYMTFNGTNSIGVSNFQVDHDDFTYEAWFNFTGLTTGSNCIMNTFESGSAEWTRMSLSYSGSQSQANTQFIVDNDSVKFDPLGGLLNAYNWYQMVCTWNKTTGTMSTYVNGSYDTGANHSQTTTILGLEPLSIGGNPLSLEYFVGNIAICKVYNYTLSASEVSANFQATRSRFGI